ncbi:MAG: O-succinylhomoserine sulfhydrylase [Acidiferrobacterales bacterium]|nr:O-succinylhomoserine sulfhydrylase [Acidiferrobacterales bacterium]
MDGKGFKTRAVRAGQSRTEENEHSDPIFATSSFVFRDSAEAASRFAETEPGNVYSRFTNPTTRAFENRLSKLENAHFCSGTASGMAAILAICMTTLKSGDHILAGRGLFGSTVNLFSNILTRFDIETTFISPTDAQDWREKLRNNTRLIFVESPSNPLCEIVDIAELAAVSREKGDCIVVVDNAACTPALQRPLELGADVVVYSATKFLDGQGRAVGGAVVTNESDIADRIVGFLRTAGPCMSPFNAWIFLKGLETLAIRMSESCASALKVANWLNAQPNVTQVHYPGLIGHSGHELAKQQQSDFGAILSFEVDGGKSAAWNLIDRLEVFSITGNLGDAKSTVNHSASTTHARIQPEDRKRAGITDGLIRLSIGLEDADDLIADLRAGLG